MTEPTDVARGREIIARWLDVAERRLAYLVDMYESGRWPRYYREDDLLQNVRDTKTAIEGWRGLLNDVSQDDFAGDVSWLGRPRSAAVAKKAPMLAANVLALAAPVGAVPPSRPPSQAMRIDLQVAATSLPSTDAIIVRAPEPPPAPVPDFSWKTALDLDVMQQRYPLLRNAY